MAARNLRWAGVSQTNASTTAGAYNSADNWTPNTIRSGDFSWTLSGSGTGEYYLRTAANGNPGLVEPTNVQYNNSGTRTNMSAGTVGSLAVNAWDYADNDALGYSTIYVRITGSGDPDSQDMDYLTYTDTPKATDHVRIPASSTQAITSGLSQRTIAIGDFIVEDGYAYAIGSSDPDIGPLYIDPDLFTFAGTGESYIDIHSANINPQILKTQSPSTGKAGLYLTGSNIGIISVFGGVLGVAMLSNQTSTVSAIRTIGPNVRVYVGSGVTLTTFRSLAGESRIRCAMTNLQIYGGIVYTEGTGAITTVTQESGIYIANSSGTVTTLNGSGGTADFLQSGIARTVTTRKSNPGHTMRYDPAVVTITNRSAPDSPVIESVSRPA